MSEPAGHALFPLNAGMTMQPKLLPTSAWIGHIPFAAWLVHALRPRVIVELGTHHGASYLALCQAAMEANVQCQAYAVDTWAGDPHAGEYGEDVFAKLSDYHAAHYDGFSKLMRMTFDDAAPYFDASTIDLLHIDGLHTYDAVRHDFETWRDRVSDRGVVLFHDIAVREREFGVWRFWAECKKDHPHFEFTHSHGLGVLAVGADVPPVLSRLCSLDAESRSVVAAMFAKLGAAAEDRVERQRLILAIEHERNAGASIKEMRTAIMDAQHVIRQDLAVVRQAVQDAEAAMNRGSEATRDAVLERLELHREDADAGQQARAEDMECQLAEVLSEMRVRSESLEASVVSGLQRLDASVHQAAKDLGARSEDSRALLERALDHLLALRAAMERWEAARLPARLRRLFGASP